MYFQSISYYLFLVHICGQQVFSEKVPKFCETKLFDGIWNYGTELQIIWRQSKGERWVWTYDQKTQTFGEPPVMETHSSKGKGVTTLTTFYVTDVPKCQTDYDFCEALNKAKNLLFIRQKNFEEVMEQTVIYRVSQENKTIAVGNEELPWQLNRFTKDMIWPNEWRFGKFKTSVFWPSKFMVIFIIYSGFKYSSALLWNQISSINWFRELKESKLNSEIHFVGMFHLNGKVFAIGRHPKRDNQSLVYEIRQNINQLEIIPKNFSVRQFFGCETTTSSSVETESTIDPIVSMRNILANWTQQQPEESTIIGAIDAVINETTNAIKGWRGIIGWSPIWVTIIVLIVVILTVLIVTIIFHLFKPKGLTKSNTETNKAKNIPKDSKEVIHNKSK